MPDIARPEINLRRQLSIKREQVGHRHPKTFRYPVECLKRRSIPAALDQAQEIYRDVEGFGELLLSHVTAEPNFPQPISEPLP
jgi:hypothetical protein